jgi:hypothetical protein
MIPSKGEMRPFSSLLRFFDCISGEIGGISPEILAKK